MALKKPVVILLIFFGVLALAAFGFAAFKFGIFSFAPKTDYRVEAELIQPESAFNPEEYTDWLVIRFSQSVIPLDGVTAEIEAEKIKITPAIKGSWSWLEQDAVIFEPAEPWLPATRYTVQFDSSFFNKNIKLEQTRFSFETPKLELSVDRFDFVVDSADETKKYLSAQISSNYQANPEELAALMKLSVISADKEDTFYGHNKEIGFNLFLDENNQVFRLVSRELPVPYGTTGFKLAVTGKLLNTSLKMDESVQVEGLHTAARILGVEIANIENDAGGFDQTLIVETSVLVRPSDIKDFITVRVIHADDNRLKTMSENEVFAQTEPLALQPAAATVPVSQLTGFVFDAPAGSKMRFEFQQGAGVYGGYVVNKAYTETLKVPSFSNAVRFQGEGNILSSVGEKQLSAYAIGYNSLHLEVARIQDSQVTHLVSQTYGDFVNLDFVNYEFNEKNISVVYQETVTLGKPEKYGMPSYFSVDLDRYLLLSKTPEPQRGLFVLSIYQSKNDSRPLARKFVMVSDIGMIHKRNTDGSSDVFVMSFSSGKPVENAAVEVVGINGVPLVKKTSDKNGRVALPDVGDFKNEKKPVMITAQSASDFSVMKLNVNSNRLSFSNFDVGGRDETNRDSVTIFTDRGIYRPGEKLNAGLIIKSRNWDRSITGTIYSAHLRDSEDNEVSVTEWRPELEGLSEFSYQIPVTASTGPWTLDVYRKLSSGSEYLGSSSFRVDEFLPDTLRAEVRIDGVTPKQLWAPLEELSFTVSVAQLNGFPAAGNRVKTEYRVQNALMSVPQYRNYTFMTPPLATNLANTGKSVTAETGPKGEAAFSYGLAEYAGATFRLVLDTTVFEKEGGRNIRRMNGLTVSPRNFLVGSENGEKFFLKNTKATLSFVAVDNEGNKKPVQGLRYQLFEQKVNTQLVRSSGGLYEYKAVRQTVPIEVIDAPFTSGEYRYTVDTGRGGDFLLNIIDENKTILAAKTFTVEGGANLAIERGKISNLDVSLITPDVSAGQEVAFFIKGPFTGNALITLERDKVYAAKWVKITERNSRQSITLPAGIDGNAFVNVILLRDYTSGDVYTSPVSIGAVNFTINRASRVNAVKLQTAKESLPGKKLAVTYSAAEKGKIILYGVDEGILLFTNYKAPDPLGVIFEQKRLQVATFQNLDLFLPEFSALRKGSADIGGDYESALGAGLNPFSRQTKKAAAFWSGVLDVSPEPQTFYYDIPDYFNGTLKIFAVAVNAAKIGVAETSALIRDKIILVPTLPLKALPGDEVQASLRLVNNTGSSDSFTLKIQLPPGMTLLKNDSLTFNLDDGKEHTVNFSFKPTDSFGAFDVKFTTSAEKTGNVKTSTENISIRPSVPYIKELYEEKIAPAKTKTFTNTRKLKKDLASITLELSYDPFGLMQTRLDFLEDYSYACSEQLISRVLPKVLLVANERFSLDKKAVQNELSETLRVLSSRMNSGGLLGAWLPDSPSVSFLDTYLAMLINAAVTQKFAVPSGIVQQNQTALREFAAMDDITGENEIRRQCQSVYLLTERGINMSAEIERLDAKIKRRSLNWKNDIASAWLATALKILKADEQADLLLKDVAAKLTVAKQPDNFYENAALYNAQLLRILTLYFADGRYDSAIKRLINTVLEESVSTTVNSSFLIAALSETVKTFAEVPRDVAVQITSFDGKTAEQKLKIGAGVLRLPLSLDTASVKVNNPNQTLPLFAVLRCAGYDENRKMPADNQGLEITRLITDKTGNKVASAKTGDELIVLLRLQATKKDRYNLVVTDLLPACFEHNLAKPLDEQDFSGASYFADRREDRILLFTDAPKGRVIELRYPVTVTAAGTYTLPPLFSENLYENNSLTLSAPEVFTVNNE